MEKRTGFVRMAIEDGYSIFPVAMVGAENAFSILWDGNDIMNSMVGKWLDKKGMLEGSALKGGETLPKVRKKVAESVESQIRDLLVIREQDTSVGFVRKLLTRLRARAR